MNLKQFDIKDGFIFGGIILMAMGLYRLEPWVSMTVTGGFLFALGMVGALRK